MKVTIDWLREYVDIDLDAETLAERLTLAGLETEGIETVAGETVIELETTSNRPDHLGAIGVAHIVARTQEFVHRHILLLRLPLPCPAARS